MNACEKLVGEFVALTRDTEPLARFRAGLHLLQTVRQDLRSGQDMRSLPVDGFLPAQVEAPQRGEAIRHLQFHAGCILLGWPGRILSAVLHQVDRREVRQGRHESVIECRNNLAGRAAGRLMLRTFAGGTSAARLHQELVRLLCVAGS